MPSQNQIIIYDLGANNGDDVEYYLLKSDLVVCVEANPKLCKLITERYQDAIELGRLVVECLVITDEDHHDQVEFYIHNDHHQLSQFDKPREKISDQFTKVELPSSPVSSLIKKHGTPHYIKIDLEHYDAQVLRSLFANQIFPPYFSAESHTIETFSLMVAHGGYTAFKLVDGRSVPSLYHEHSVTRLDTQSVVSYSFPSHSAGPYGDDINGPWMGADMFFKLLAIEGLGWKDIQATRCQTADSLGWVRECDYLLRFANRRFSVMERLKIAMRLMKGALKSLVAKTLK